MDEDIAIFTTDQISDYGFPDEDLYPKYYVIESPPEMVMGYVHAQHSQFRKIHRYDRDARFRTQVRNLLGDSKSNIDPDFLGIIKSYMTMQQGVNPYEGCRNIIRHFKKPSYYALIPTILIKLGYSPMLTLPGDLDLVIRKVFVHYKAFETEFFRDPGERKYFPNMKYLALKLLEKYGVVNTMIPKLRTTRKLKSMDKIFKKVDDLLISNK